MNNYYNGMKKKFQSQQDPFSKNAQGISNLYHAVLLLRKNLQEKPQIRNMNFSYYNLYYTDIKTRDEKKDIDNQFENDYNDFIAPNHYVVIKPREKILKKVQILKKSFQLILTI